VQNDDMETVDLDEESKPTPEMLGADLAEVQMIMTQAVEDGEDLLNDYEQKFANSILDRIGRRRNSTILSDAQLEMVETIRKKMKKELEMVKPAFDPDDED